MRTTDGGESWYPIDVPSDVRSSEITYVPGTSGTYLIQDGDVLGDQDMLVSHDDGNTWKLVSSNANLSCFEFLSASVGYAGGEIQGPETGGIYRWERNLLTGTVGIFESDFKKGFPPVELFPVPARDEINITLPEGFGDLITIEIFDLDGRKVLQKEVINAYTLNIEDLSAGMYLMRIRDKQQSYSGKFLKE